MPSTNPKTVRRAMLGASLAALAAFAAFAAFALAHPAQAADQALLIGVNHYGHLEPGHDLGGCVNDAQMMAVCLKQYGFATTVLSDDTATKVGILTALAGLKAQLKPGDRVVVYFAGHGTVSGTGQTSILPSDADSASDKNDMHTDELYAAVRALPAQSRTILLDSCHSAGMVRSLSGLRGVHKLVPRVYLRAAQTRDLGNRSWQIANVNGADNIADTTKGGGVAYFTASLKTQVANELEIEGKKHGLFTYYLSQALTDAVKSGGKLPWKNVVSQVTEKVAELTDGEQKPILGPTTFLKEAVFAEADIPESTPPTTEASRIPAVTANTPTPPIPSETTAVALPNIPSPEPAAAKSAATGVTLDGVYNLSAPDPDRIVLEMVPGVSPVLVGDSVHFRITVKRDGYLLLIGKDPQGKLSVLYPENASGGATPIKSGTVLNLPSASDEAFTPDTPGTDGLKVILFTSKDAADALLQSFNGGSLDIAQANREWKKKRVPPSDFYTSEIITQIVAKASPAGAATPATPAAPTSGEPQKANGG